jgi:DNA-binding CsgD family transcriptional regulator
MMRSAEGLRSKRVAKRKRGSAGPDLHRSPNKIGRQINDATVLQEHNSSPQNGLQPNGLTSDLACTDLSTQRLHFVRARAAAEALGLVGLPAAVLNDEGKLLAANNHLVGLVPETLCIDSGRITLARAADNVLFAQVLSLCGVGTSNGNLRSIPLQGRLVGSSMIMHMVRVSGPAREFFPGASTLVIFTSIGAPCKAPRRETLQRLFNLSGAEARVACGIAERQTVEVIANNLGISRETVRSHLKSVLAKTGTRRQLDLALLLVGAGSDGFVGRFPREITQMGDAGG